MSRAVAGSLWVLAGLLAIVATAELAWPRAKSPSAPPPPQPAAGPVAATAATPIGEWTSAILARPLFNPDRRPTAVAAAATPAAASRQPPPRLTGILVTPEGNRAIFAAADGKGATVAREGARLGAWQVVAIHHGDVQLTGPDGTRTVRPSYSDAPAQAAGTQSDAAPPPSARGLLPPLPPTDTRPAGATEQPSGAWIFSNTPQVPAARTTR